MRRPLPNIPRGPRRRAARPAAVLLACPRLSPEWELSALAALMKPRPARRAAVEHRTGDQAWPAGADAALDTILTRARERLGLTIDVHRHAAGDYHFAAQVPRDRLRDALAVAWAVSRAVDCWITVGRVHARGGVFYRRRLGNRLDLVVAANVHLPRGARKALTG